MQVHASLQVQRRHRAALRSAEEGEQRSIHVDVSCRQHAGQTRVTSSPLPYHTFFYSLSVIQTDREPGGGVQLRILPMGRVRRRWQTALGTEGNRPLNERETHSPPPLLLYFCP